MLRDQCSYKTQTNISHSPQTSSSPWELHPEGVVLRVRLTPNAARAHVGALEYLSPDGHTGYDWLKVQVTALPENGKANCALLKILAKHFKIARSRLHILRGKKDRFKHILFQDLSNPGDLPPI